MNQFKIIWIKLIVFLRKTGVIKEINNVDGIGSLTDNDNMKKTNSGNSSENHPKTLNYKSGKYHPNYRSYFRELKVCKWCSYNKRRKIKTLHIMKKSRLWKNIEWECQYARRY
jgi:hypothetical protein